MMLCLCHSSYAIPTFELRSGSAETECSAICPYWTTSSVRSSSVGEIVSPNVVAVLRLTVR
jgi:hypothetical protein